MKRQQWFQSRLWYVATPYSRYPLGKDRAFVDACRATAFLMRGGLKVFCPIAHSHAVAENGSLDKDNHDFWLDQDLAFWEVSQGMIIVEMPGWKESYGVREEIKWFRLNEKPIRYLPWPLAGLDPLRPEKNLQRSPSRA